MWRTEFGAGEMVQLLRAPDGFPTPQEAVPVTTVLRLFWPPRVPFTDIHASKAFII